MRINGHEIKTTNDAVAKFLFTNQPGEKFSRAYANAVLEDLGFDKITNFKIKSPVFSPAKYNARTSIFDVKGETSNKDQFNFEIQRQNHAGFCIRLISNCGLQFTRVKRSRKYKTYPNFIVIALLNFELDIEPKIPEYHDCFCCLSIIKSSRSLSRKAQIHVLELPKWEKIHEKAIKIEDVQKFTDLDYFMCLFSDKTTYKELKVMAAQCSFINEAKQGLEAFVGDPANLAAYEEAQEAERIRADRESFVIDQAVDDTRRTFIKNLRKMNMSDKDIADAGNMTLEEVQSY